MTPSSRNQSFFVDGPLPGENDIIKAAKGVGGRGILYAKLKREWNAKVVQAVRAYEIQPIKGPRLLSFLWQEPTKRRDPDNIVAGKKFILDGLVQAGILKGDGWRHILGFQDVWVIDQRCPGVWVHLEPVTKGDE